MNAAHRRFAWRGVLSGSLFALLLSRVHWAELAAVLRGTRPGPLALGFCLIGCCPFLMAARTRLLLGQWFIALSYRSVLALTWVGQFCNAFLPGSTGGDAVKLYRVCRLAPDRKTAGFAALLADRLVALSGLILLASAALFGGGGHQLLREIARAGSAHVGGRNWLFIFGLSLLALWLAVIFWHRYGYFARDWAEKARGIGLTLRQGLYPSPALGAALLLALAVHALALASCYEYCRALRIPAGFAQVMLIWPVTTLAVLLPLTVNGHGLREFILLFYFQRWHLRSALAGGHALTETVLAMSLLMVATDFFWSLPGGLSLVFQSRQTAGADGVGLNAVPAA